MKQEVDSIRKMYKDLDRLKGIESKIFLKWLKSVDSSRLNEDKKEIENKIYELKKKIVVESEFVYSYVGCA